MEHSPNPKEITSRFVKLLADLAKREVKFVVVGGLAVIFNGYPRVTLDADILVDSDEDNLELLLASLKNWGEGWARELEPKDFSIEAGCVRVTENFDLDIFTEMKGKKYADFQPRFRFLEIDGFKIQYLSPADLIYLKSGS